MAADPMKAVNAATDLVPLRDRVADALERLARLLMRRTGASGTDGSGDDVVRLRSTMQFLGQIATGWSAVPDEAVRHDGAGYGSRVVVEDLDTGRTETLLLMAGPMLDFDAGQVSLASPIGSALLGASAGDVMDVQTPQRRRRLRVVSVRTLHDLLADDEPAV